MKNYISYLRPLRFPGFLLFLSCLLIPNLLKAQVDSIGWKANVAKINITPKAPMWMAGFASRTKPSQGVIHPIWSKALVIQDKDKNTAVLITNDLSGMPRDMSTRIKKKIKTRYGLNEDAVLLNFSHSHSGPVLKDYLYHVYPLSDDEIDKVNTYSDWLEDQIVELVGQALKGLIPAKIFTENGLTRFQVNRRNNTEAELGATTTTNGPNDYAVPVLKVTDRKDNIMAVAFGYACHATVLSVTQWSGDYPGFAQVELEKMYPGATAMFFQGAGANQNPLPRRTIPLAQKYGKELAAAVESVLNEDMKPLAAQLKTAYSEIALDLNEPPSNEVLEKMIKESSGHYQRWAVMMHEKVKNNTVELSYPYPIQIWKLGDQLMVALGGEPVVDYAVKLKTQYGNDLFVLGYSNDVMAYIPSRTVLEEGGYEGATSQIAFGHPGTWKPTLETKIFKRINRMMAGF
ncbi:neutral/alkaline non-lysosomal ceramidase N-terminal domain-containing protein [Cyclobacterium sp. 1_MG-2023]|uniref:neutral/alkaline non-lysosomal ceramidase N-terminal domain-containing protein n=1 Tax=Cyclobacterium sp. 1_MG-2023 TaxID=3062681 RepID=UPI0026E20EFC|nr:neutral/alkaline non-lysosomal ceramidase N-terminal domain-containing protein [Cyclobacterium sp. 1_MG-2023]MDO6436501.1 neutral/alkaline non-lysosomal ceramidase N-terminal domain-containing protein [Cyclobacterium sp. 1_MG-2023]